MFGLKSRIKYMITLTKSDTEPVMEDNLQDIVSREVWAISGLAAWTGVGRQVYNEVYNSVWINHVLQVMLALKWQHK
jgi:hypothetical protein